MRLTGGSPFLPFLASFKATSLSAFYNFISMQSRSQSPITLVQQKGRGRLWNNPKPEPETVPVE